jgi:hypothetical protein
VVARPGVRRRHVPEEELLAHVEVLLRHEKFD